MTRASLTMTAKGQVTFRKEIQKHLGVLGGGKIVADVLPDGKVLLSPPPKGKISDIFGMLKRPGQPRLTIEEINEVIADSWAGKRGPWR